MRAQKGQALLECIIALALMMLLSFWGSAQWNSRVQQARVRSMAAWLQEIHKALGQDSGYASSLLQGMQARGGTASAGASNMIAALKSEARLPAGFAEQPPMNYELELLPLASSRCAGAVCAHELLLLAKPDLAADSEQTQRDALDLMLALDGKVAAVLWSNPDSLQGAGMHYPNPPSSSQRLPLGTVALLLWRSDHLPPYVRLAEDRVVRFSSSVTFDGATQFDQPIDARRGILVSYQVSDGAACSTSGHLARLSRGGLAICENGRWGSVARTGRQFKACDSAVGRGLLAMWVIDHKHKDIFGGGSVCECSGGYIARYMGEGMAMFEGIQTRDGYVCEPL